MPLNKFLKIADRIAKEDKALFDALIEFEKTKKMKTKERMNFTIDKVTAEKFKRFCREHGYNMSAKVEQVISRIIKQNN